MRHQPDERVWMGKCIFRVKLEIKNSLDSVVVCLLQPDMHTLPNDVHFPATTYAQPQRSNENDTTRSSTGQVSAAAAVDEKLMFYLITLNSHHNLINRHALVWFLLSLQSRSDKVKPRPPNGF